MTFSRRLPLFPFVLSFLYFFLFAVEIRGWKRGGNLVSRDYVYIYVYVLELWEGQVRYTGSLLGQTSFLLYSNY